jgi:hypothetical protein
MMKALSVRAFIYLLHLAEYNIRRFKNFCERSKLIVVLLYNLYHALITLIVSTMTVFDHSHLLA